MLQSEIDFSLVGSFPEQINRISILLLLKDIEDYKHDLTCFSAIIHLQLALIGF